MEPGFLHPGHKLTAQEKVARLIPMIGLRGRQSERRAARKSLSDQHDGPARLVIGQGALPPRGFGNITVEPTPTSGPAPAHTQKIGSAQCRERASHYLEISVVVVTIKKKT